MLALYLTKDATAQRCLVKYLHALGQTAQVLALASPPCLCCTGLPDPQLNASVLGPQVVPQTKSTTHGFGLANYSVKR